MEFDHEAAESFLVFIGQQIEGLVLHIVFNLLDIWDLVQSVEVMHFVNGQVVVNTIVLRCNHHGILVVTKEEKLRLRG